MQKREVWWTLGDRQAGAHLQAALPGAPVAEKSNSSDYVRAPEDGGKHLMHLGRVNICSYLYDSGSG